MARTIFRLLMGLCRVLAWPLGTLHSIFAVLGLVRLPAAIALSPVGRLQILRACWFTRFARELLPLVLVSPLRAAALDCVRFDDSGYPYSEGGCVYATVHSPWGRLLARWCRERSRDLVVAQPAGWSLHLGESAIGTSFPDLRRLVTHLRSGGRIFVAVDFVPEKGGYALRFLGAERDAPLLPARLAAVAGVPLVVALASFAGGNIAFTCGSPVPVRRFLDEERATQTIMAQVERRIRADPALWSETLRGAIGLRVVSKPGREESAVDPDGLTRHEGSGR